MSPEAQCGPKPLPEAKIKVETIGVETLVPVQCEGKGRTKG